MSPAGAEVSPSDAPPEFVASYLEQYCFKCHGPEKQLSDLRLDQRTSVIDSHDAHRFWDDVLARLNEGEMPPPDSPQPSSDETQRVIDYLTQQLRAATGKLASEFALRRLNRYEYANSVRDLLGVEVDISSIPVDQVDEGFDNNGNRLSLSPTLMQRYVQLAQQITDQVLPAGNRPTAFAKNLYSSKPAATVEGARGVLQRFASRAFRRPVSPAKLDRLTALVQSSLEAGRSFQEALSLGVQATLCSPQFLFLVEPPGQLDDYALAARLSYFVWSSLPDKQLTDLAAAGQLNHPSELERQTLRMLADPKASALVANFAGQWLGVRDVGVMQPDKELFPEYDAELEESIRQETLAFFAEILHNNLSALNFIDSDFAMLNQRLARHYGVPGVVGSQLRKVALRPEYQRGGVLGQASMLSSTSDGVRSSPVVRGVWVLQRLLGKPPAPPPPDVPDLEPDTRGTRTIREELERHRSVPACMACHRSIDPLGLALENYDAIGRWRLRYAAPPAPKKGRPQPGLRIDAKTQTEDGREFEGPTGLKQLLLDRQDDFLRCLAEQLLSYAMGRGLAPNDAAAVDDLVRRSQATELRFRDLIVAVVRHPAFAVK